MNRDLTLIQEEFPELERYELQEGPAYQFEVNRRQFVQVLGTGILISLAGPSIYAQRSNGSRKSEGAERLHIGADGVITLMTSKVEVGQGSRTQITQAAAEELGVPVSRIRLVMADSALVPNDGGTAGSRTTPSTIPTIRKACAAARELLLESAAAEFNQAKSGLTFREGRVFNPVSEKQFGYVDLAKKSDLQENLTRRSRSEVRMRKVSTWKVMGTSVAKIGADAIVTGRHLYPSDINRPGMLYGKVLRAPSYGAKLTSIDLSAAESIQGVTAVRDSDFVGFAAPTSSKAQDALLVASSTAVWETSSQPSSDDLYEHLRTHQSTGRSRSRRSRGGTKGSVAEGLKEADKVFRASFHIAYIQHAPMEPRTAVAEWKDGAVTVWTGTQQPSRVQGELSAAFSIPSDKVRVIVPDTGGGFGGKHTGEAAVEAARLALAAKRPVSLRWTREEEFTWAYFRPAGVIDVTGGIARDGSIVAWEHINLNSGGSAVGTPYDIPNTRTESKSCDSPLREGSYRALASAANVFARESFMDELSSASGMDALAFRLRQLPNGRLRDVLEAAAKRFDWPARRQRTKGSSTHGIGLACGTEKGSYAAACVEVEVDAETGVYKVLEIVQAYECGAIQNPLNLQKQVEGCIMQGLGGALTEEIRFKNGRITNPRFSSYRVPRFKDVPTIDIVLVNRPDLTSVGGSETPIIAVAPAIANALAAASGVRIRSLPIRNKQFRPV